jgi:hypothetical protein
MNWPIEFVDATDRGSRFICLRALSYSGERRTIAPNIWLMMWPFQPEELLRSAFFSSVLEAEVIESVKLFAWIRGHDEHPFVAKGIQRRTKPYQTKLSSALNDICANSTPMTMEVIGRPSAIEFSEKILRWLDTLIMPGNTPYVAHLYKTAIGDSRIEPVRWKS